MSINGHNVTAMRNGLNLTKVRLAAHAGVSLATVKRAENGHGLHRSSAEKLANALGVTVDSLYEKDAA